MKQIAIIGRERNLALAELETVFGAVEPILDDVVAIKDENSTSIDRLGSVIKIGKIVATTQDMFKLESLITAELERQVLEDKKTSIDFGVSIYADKYNPKDYRRLVINIKKLLQKSKIKSRFVLPKSLQLNAAQVKHNKLLRKGSEIMVIISDRTITIAKTEQIQNIDSYSLRDFGRPNRNMQVGMFPPKLAQIMLNLAQAEESATIYDPFCGSGVVLQEAMLMGRVVWGSDIAEKMVRASVENIHWLQNEYRIDGEFKVFEADATKLDTTPDKKYSIVTEGYLGKMYSQTVTSDEIATQKSELSKIYLAFLDKIISLEQTPESVVITIPCWQTKSGLEALNIIDQIEKLGYTIKQFKSVRTLDLIYKREKQVVGRQILVLRPKNSIKKGK